MKIKDFAIMINSMIANGSITGEETLVLDGMDGNENNFVWEPNSLETCCIVSEGSCAMLWYPKHERHTHLTLAYKED